MEQSTDSGDRVLGESGFLNPAHVSRTVYLMIYDIYLLSPEITLRGWDPGQQASLSM